MCVRMSPGGVPLPMVRGVAATAPRGVFVTATVALVLLPAIVNSDKKDVRAKGEMSEWMDEEMNEWRGVLVLVEERVVVLTLRLRPSGSEIRINSLGEIRQCGSDGRFDWGGGGGGGEGVGGAVLDQEGV